MNIAMIVYRQVPYVSANTSIAYDIADELNKNYNHKVTFIGYMQDEKQKEISHRNEHKIVFFNNKQYALSKKRILNSINERFLKKYNVLKQYSKKIEEIVESESIDIILIFSAPSITIDLINNFKHKAPIILYQLDPYYSSYFLSYFKKIALKKIFIKILKKINILFTTPLLLKEYKADNQVKKYIQKISSLEFPKIKEYKFDEMDSKEYFPDDKKINIAYVGNLYTDIRSPNILIKFAFLFQDFFKIHFIGDISTNSDDLKREFINSLYKNGVCFYGYSSQDFSKKIIHKAEILLNIGNNIVNQMGSKLIEYFSSGSPIINIYQLLECPTLNYTKKYPYCLDIYVNDIDDQYIMQKVINFSKEHLNKKLNYVKVKELFPECTVEYVSKVIHNSITHIMHDR